MFAEALMLILVGEKNADHIVKEEDMLVLNYCKIYFSFFADRQDSNYKFIITLHRSINPSAAIISPDINPNNAPCDIRFLLLVYGK